MPSPLGLLLAGGAALLLLSQGGKKEDKPAGSGGSGGAGAGGAGTGGAPPTALGCELDASLPPSWADMVKQLTSSPVNPGQELAWATQLDDAAAKVAAAGYPKAAACLKKRAEEVRKKAGSQTSPPPLPGQTPPIPGGATPIPGGGLPGPAMPAGGGDMPFTIRSGDRPYGLAIYWTGNGARFQELGALNPNLGQLVTKNGVTNYEHWQVGVGIKIPSSWDPWKKPNPPTGL